MSIFYSPSTGGFFSADLHGDTIPADAIAISKARHVQLLQGQANGQAIVASDDGTPVLCDYPAPTTDQLLTALRAQRDQLLRDSDFTQIPDAPIEEATRDAWRAYRQALRDLTETTADLSAIAWPTPPVA